jgi:hypothetical protein
MQVSGAPKSVRQQLQPSYVIKSSLNEPPHVGHGGLRGGAGGGAGRSTMLQTVAVIFSVEGVPGFFRGGYPSVIKTSLSSGVYVCMCVCVRMGVRLCVCVCERESE